MDKVTRTVPDRKLGSSWSQWDGDIARHESALNEGPALFASLFLLTLCLASGLLAALVWTAMLWIAPALSGFWSMFLALFSLPWGTCLLCAAVVLFRRRGLAFPWLSGFLSAAVPWLSRLYSPFGFSRDRISSSCMAITNVISRLRLQKYPSSRPMVLLPRCLSRETIGSIREAAAEFDCPVFILGTNAQARARVSEFQPTSIIAVACERDLVRGVVDYGGKMPVLVIANQRPKGPCLEATIDMAQLRRALRDSVGER